MAARAGGPDASADLVNPVALSFGIPDERTAGRERAKQIRQIHTEAALFATRHVVTWLEEFAAGAGQKRMILLSFGRDNGAKHLSGEPRFDQAFGDWLKGRPYPIVDRRDAFAADYRKYKVDVEQYLAPFYNGHHTPRGHFFTAWALKDTIVQWRNPKPVLYR